MLEASVAHHGGWLSMKKRRRVCSSDLSNAADPHGVLQHQQHDQQALRLTEAQRAVAQLVSRGTSLFLTGPAGTGKSQLLQSISNVGGPTIAMTAMTGSAAVLLQGQTLHAWAGIGQAEDEAEVLAAKVLQDASSYSRWRSTSLLIIDEVSMMSAVLLDKLDFVGRKVRGRPSQPLGGLQVLLSGDFHQLPPPSVRKEGWAFEAKCWKKLIPVTAELTEVLRLDPEERDFARLLCQVRRGRLDEEAWALLTSRRLPPSVEESVWCRELRRASHLVSTNAEADKVNSIKLANLATRPEVKGGVGFSRDPITFWAVAASPGGFDHAGSGRPPANNAIPLELPLAVGATVVLTHSLSVGANYERWTNGARAMVVGFSQISARLFDPKCVVSGLSEIEPGALLPKPVRRFLERHYGVLPRLALLPEADGAADEENDEQEEEREREEEEGTSSGHVIYPMVSGHGSDTKVQLPLRLGWALTVHRAQGMTLDSCVVHLDRISNSGQAYVAMSRVRRASSLWITGKLPQRSPTTGHVVAFAPAKEVRDFYDRLEDDADDA